MKATELRIGNWLMSDGVPVQVDGRTIFDFWHYGENGVIPLRYEPMPLTEEWLVRFGFDKDGFKQYEFINWGIKVKKDPHAISEPNWIVFHGFMNQFSEIVSLKHVHQLQNLFYCLCGEELEIKS